MRVKVNDWSMRCSYWWGEGVIATSHVANCLLYKVKYASTLLLVVHPLTLIGGSICVVVLSLSVGAIIDPFSLVAVSVCVNQSSLSIGFVIFPVADKITSVLPDLFSLSISWIMLSSKFQAKEISFLKKSEWRKICWFRSHNSLRILKMSDIRWTLLVNFTKKWAFKY